jgi:excisionase family DNA binding protein
MEKLLLSMDDAVQLSGFKKSTLYKLTANKILSHYKPFGKRIFFSREQLEQVMTRRRVKSVDELAQEQNDSLTFKKEKK